MWKYRDLLRTKKFIETEIWTSKSESSKWIELICWTMRLRLVIDFWGWKRIGMSWNSSFSAQIPSASIIQKSCWRSASSFHLWSSAVVGAWITWNSSLRIVSIPPSVTCYLVLRLLPHTPGSLTLIGFNLLNGSSFPFWLWSLWVFLS